MGIIKEIWQENKFMIGLSVGALLFIFIFLLTMIITEGIRLGWCLA